MSLDTITRVNEFFKDTIATPNSLFTIYEEENKRIPDGNGRGPMVRLFIEVGNETLFNDGNEYFEEGVIIAQIFVDVGESTSDQHRIATTIKNAFRQIKLPATITNEGDIFFQDIEMGNGGQVPKQRLRNNTTEKQRWWVRQDVFITYNKYGCDIVAPPTNIFTSTWDTTQAGSASDTIILPYAGGNTTDWGDGTINTSNTHTYASGGIKTVTIEGVITGFVFMGGGDAMKILTVDSSGELVFDGGTFRGCNSLTVVNISDNATVASTSVDALFQSTSLVTLTGLANLDTSSVTRFSSMFLQAMSILNLDLSGLNTSSATLMTNMFFALGNKGDEISGLDSMNVEGVTNMGNMFLSTTISTQKYSDMLISFEAQSVQNNVSFSGGNSQYSVGAATTARAALISDHSWTITDGGQA